MTAAFVTGAASGIGRGLVGALLRDGHSVVATDVRTDALEEAAKADGWNRSVTTLCALDVSSQSAWNDAIAAAEKAVGRIDFGFNVAGILIPNTTMDLDERAIDLHLDVNVKGVILGTKALAHHMSNRGESKKGRGHIVNIGSLASLAPVPGMPLYCASKFAVRGFTLSAAVELAEIGIALSLVMPDAVETPMLDLQKNRSESALTFSGPRPLTVDEVVTAIVTRVLVDKPLELTLPPSRGALARVATAAPQLSKVLYPLLKKKGLEAQKKSRR